MVDYSAIFSAIVTLSASIYAIVETSKNAPYLSGILENIKARSHSSYVFTIHVSRFAISAVGVYTTYPMLLTTVPELANVPYPVGVIVASFVIAFGSEIAKNVTDILKAIPTR